MSGHKLVLLKQAMDFVINHLGLSDRLNIVTFNESPTIYRVCLVDLQIWCFLE
jgi:hypothetical protein